MTFMFSNENNLPNAVSEFKQKGYTDDFVIEDNHFVSTITGLKLGKDDVNFITGFKFEITENALDTQNLFVIESAKYKTKGLLIDLLGRHLFLEEKEDIAKLLDIPLLAYVFRGKE